MAQLLIDLGAKVSAADRDGWTPLHRASHEGHEAVARLLVGRGADVSAADKDGWTPLHRATQIGHMAVARLLRAREATGNQATAPPSSL